MESIFSGKFLIWVFPFAHNADDFSPFFLAPIFVCILCAFSCFDVNMLHIPFSFLPHIVLCENVM